jgi:hypothetical protein
MPEERQTEDPHVIILNLIETAIERVIDPHIRAVVRGTLRSFTTCQSTLDDIVQTAKIGVFRVIRNGSQTPWEVGVTRYAAGAGRNCAKKYLRDRRRCQPFVLLENDSISVRSGVSMADVVEIIDRAVTDPRGREMVVAYVENPSLSVAERGRLIGINSRATACRVWNKALVQLLAWYERLEAKSCDVQRTG